MKRYVLVVLSVLSFSHPRNAAADVTLFWDSNVETDLAGYQILYGIAPRTYTSIVDVGNRTSHQFTNPATRTTSPCARMTHKGSPVRCPQKFPR